METIYFTTSNFIRHEGNVVDLTEYRRKLACAKQTASPVEPLQEESSAPRPRTVHRRIALSGMVLDCAASVALIITALSFAFAVL